MRDRTHMSENVVGFPFGVKPIAIRAQCVYPHRDAQSFGPSCERAGISRPLRKTGGRSCATMGAPDFRRSRRTPWTKHASPPLMP